MKIVKKGVRPPKYHWVGQWSCGYCQSIIELEESDDPKKVKWDDDQRDGESVTITCPVCGERRTMSRAKAPPSEGFRYQ